MRAFVAYHYGQNVSHIYRILKDNDIHFFDSMTDLNYGTSLQESILNEIKASDIVIIVYSEVSGNLGFEAGIAVALKKPIFSIISEKENYPDFLMDTTHVYANPSDSEKIEFSLKHFLKNIKPKPKKSKTTKKDNQWSNSKRWRTEYDKIEYRNAVALEHFFHSIFEELSIEYIEQPKNSKIDYRADFSIWNDDLEAYFGNPTLIEIKYNLTNRNINSAINQLNDSINKTNAKSAIIFYAKITKSLKNEIKTYCQPNLLIIDISDFVIQLDKFGLQKAILKLRNEIVHNF